MSLTEDNVDMIKKSVELATHSHQLLQSQSSRAGSSNEQNLESVNIIALAKPK